MGFSLLFILKFHIINHMYSYSESWMNEQENQVKDPFILTGGGGQFDPPPPRTIHVWGTAADRDTPFYDFFLSSLTHLLIPSLSDVTRVLARSKFCCICLFEITDFDKML